MRRQYLINGIVVSMLILLVFSQITQANDAPVKILGGGATPSPLAGPITENIVMESEVVRITLGEKTFVVDARFVLNNVGNAAELWVGFPKRGLGRISQGFNSTSDFITFETWVNEEKVKFTEEAGFASIEGVYTLPELIQKIKADTIDGSLYAKDFRWMVKFVGFPAKKKLTTRVRYEVPYENYGFCEEAHYIYGTGAYWKGNIGKSTFIVDSSNISEKSTWDDVSFPEKRKKMKMKRSQIKKGVIQYELSNFKPDIDEELVVLTACPE